MQAHPLFAKVGAPREAAVGHWTLRWLTEADLDEDYRAVFESKVRLQSFLGGGWPGDITREENRLDLAHHHVEFLPHNPCIGTAREKLDMVMREVEPV
ncbi:MAG: hypothetical protein AAFY66_14570, partial [Pseudomonadota bacterium]